jgi:transposase
MPLGVVVRGANANDGCQTEEVLQGLVVHPPVADSPVQCEDWRSFPRIQADGAYGNSPSRERARRAGFRLQAPTPGKASSGVGKIRNAVERCHNFFAQFGRVFRRFDRSARHYLGWLELAACIILLRSGFVS